MKTVWFHRDFRRFQGGHLKVWDYFCHVASVPSLQSKVYFTPESVWDDSNPWLSVRADVERRFAPQEADIVFVAGMDWQPLLPVLAQQAPKTPILNLIQHVRHADAAQPLFAFLSQPAVRICVSAEVAQAIEATGRVNGPILTIPNGIELARFASRPWDQRNVDVLIVGNKQPQMAQALANRLGDGRQVVCVTHSVPRQTLLEVMARARVVVCLPTPTEGFYLPALEAMASGCLVVCPDAVGNRGFCRDGQTCLMPVANADALAAAVQVMETCSDARRETMRNQAQAQAALHDLMQERRAFTQVIADLPALWKRTQHS